LNQVCKNQPERFSQTGRLNHTYLGFWIELLNSLLTNLVQIPEEIMSRRYIMPEQFLNPSPSTPITRLLFFDFPCDGSTAVNTASTYRANGCPPNYNLAATGVEQLYGLLGSPGKEQGHPYMREAASSGAGGEAEDPTEVDQIVDMDRGMEICHTGRLSGSLVPLIASKPQYSIVKITAVSVSLVGPTTQSIQIQPGIATWLEPGTNTQNTWFYRMSGGVRQDELLYSARRLITTAISGLGFTAETVYKLVYHWEFWKDTGDPPYPDVPNTSRPRERLPISGFDESIAFQVITRTGPLP
jgi:hypothetical protein